MKSCARATATAVAIMFFGPAKLAGLGKGLGEGIRGFKGALKDEPTGPKSATPDGTKQG